MSENPWIKFYPRDWRGDQALRAVSIAARGLWLECLCIMHEAKPYGHLLLNGSPVEDGALARMTGVPVDEVPVLMTELRQAGVLSVTGKGVVFSRRMTKDHARAQKGRKAVIKRWSQATENAAEMTSPNRSPNRAPITQKPEARGQKEKPPSAAKTAQRRSAVRLDPAWKPDEEDRAFALGLGATEREIDRTAATYRDYWLAKSGKDAAKADWPATWRNWCRREADSGRFSGPQRSLELAHSAPSTLVDVSEQQWRERLNWAREREEWQARWGPLFGEPGSLVPEHLVTEPYQQLFQALRQKCSPQRKAG